ncbi:hypothetical protein [Geodermatophilus sp. URMC 63]
MEERKKRWGVTSPIYQSEVLCEFPDISDDSLIDPKWIKAAQQRSLQRNWKPQLGPDIARYGEDETTIYRREGGWAPLYRSHSKTDTMTTTGHIVRARDEINVESQISSRSWWMRSVWAPASSTASSSSARTWSASTAARLPSRRRGSSTRRAELYWACERCSKRDSSTSTQTTTSWQLSSEP